MKVFSAAFILLLLVVHVAHGANDDAIKQVVKGKVEDMNKAVIAEDFGKVADLTYPKLVEMMGGRQKMISAMQAGIKDMKTNGFGFGSFKVSAPSDPVRSGSDLYVVAPFVLEMKAPGGKLSQKTFVIGISADMGATWFFVNGDLDIKIVKQVLPGLPDALKLPEKHKPVFESQ